MDLIKICSLDHSLKIVFKKDNLSDDCLEFITLTDLKLLQPSSIIFIKNKTFLEELNLLDYEKFKMGLIIEEKFWSSLSENEHEKLKNNFIAILTSEDVNVSMSRLSKDFFDLKFKDENNLIDGRVMGNADIHATALIAQNVFIGCGVSIGANVKIHPGAVIMTGSKILEDSEIFPNVVIYHNVVIGKNVRIHAGAVIGADGFGYNFKDGQHLKVWHIGGVKISDNVEIGANSCVDSGTFSPTVVGEGTKMDNFVQVAHNCQVGKKVILCGDVALAGSSTLGDYVVIGGKSAVGNNVVMGAGSQLAAFSGLIQDAEPKKVMGGYPAREYKEWMRGMATLRRLSEKKSKE